MIETTFVDLIIKLISTLGFPIFVAVWLLVRTDSLLKELKKSIDTLNDTIYHTIPHTDPG